MGKITVKHYLNTKIKPEIRDNENCYPVYVQITMRRKTTQYRSLTFCTLSETEFNNYIKGHSYNADFIDRGIFTKEYFEKEPERIQKAIEFITNGWNFKLSQSSFDLIWSWVKDLFLIWTDEGLISGMWGYIECNTNKAKIYKPFNKKYTLTDSIKTLNKVLHIDIKDKIIKEDLELWNNVTLLLKHYGKKSIYIDFVCTYKNEIKKIKGIKNKEEFIKMIQKITADEMYYLLC